MVVFPVAKLGYLAVRQISKPLANAIKVRAKNHPFFRNWICMPPAQLYHWIEVNVRMRVMQMGAPTKVSRLSEQQAIDLGGEMLGEFIIFSIATACLVAEYKRSSRKEALKEQIQNTRLLSLEQRLREVGFGMEKQSVQIRELTRCAADLSTLNSGWLSRKPAALHPALQEATKDEEIPHYSAPILTDLIPTPEGIKDESADADAADSSKLSLLDKLRPSRKPYKDQQHNVQHTDSSLEKTKKSRDAVGSAPSAVSSQQQTKKTDEEKETTADAVEIIDEHNTMQQQPSSKIPTFMSAAAIEKLTRVITNDNNNEQQQAS